MPLTPVAQSGGGGGGATTVVMVAANDAPATVKARALYLCDGTNDQVQIQEALDDQGANAFVQLSQGQFNVSGPIVLAENGATLAGTGIGQRAGATQTSLGTTIFAASGFSGTAVVQVKGVSIVSPVYGVTLRDFTVDLHSSIVASVDCVYYSSNRGLIDHVHVFNATADGFRFKGVNGWDLYDTEIISSQASRCVNGAGIHFDTDSPDCHVIGCVLFDNKYGFNIEAGSEQITNCHTYSNTYYNFWFNSSGSRSKVVNCKIEGAGRHGVFLDGATTGTSDVMILGCNFKNSSQETTNTWDHLYVENTTAHSRTTIVGNNFSYQSSGSPPKPRYGVNFVGSNSQNPVLVGNNFGSSTHWGTGPVNDNSNTASPLLAVGNGGWIRSIRKITKSSNYTAIQLDEVIVVTAGGTDKTITLPAAASLEARLMTIIRADAAAGNVIVDGNASETINGALTKTLGAQYSAVTIVPHSGNWLIVNQLGTVT